MIETVFEQFIVQLFRAKSYWWSSLRGNFPGGNWPGSNYLGGNYPGGNCPVTLATSIKKLSYGKKKPDHKILTRLQKFYQWLFSNWLGKVAYEISLNSPVFVWKISFYTILCHWSISIPPENVRKPLVSCGFGHIYWTNP